ncbi:Formate hydrogenlyase subunit 3/Multisubunit Na+/H+ antiporter, MnhD subunit [Nakamurella panacisegetis]|uniref:Formate hydrogenlyase subunit 3/Multisubunit Na+/H+ antiporter, MnhD subunit n=1 Tax=Nakamurella panacisegetis TaxID=1090615 RepID=A0A1H0RUN3_9ACTN|nr:proton-conducting transporter membrane subunit [Nakamurella panacisegetis]SDP33167.1 Formate hydrogenlyase subunit 3/Multisubunit Na+/H+ antiporter, MnhD subunit [Nakamurella panacisegetis]
MTLVAWTLAIAVGLGLLSCGGGAALPRRWRARVVGVGTAAAGSSGVLTGIAALGGHGLTVKLPDLLPLSGVWITVDPLSGVFMAATGGVAVATGIYGISYGRHGLDGRGVQVAFPLFVTAMLLVPIAASVGAFLLCWELMALTSLLLVLAEHRRRPAVASAGRWYAVMTHLALLAILSGLMLLAGHAADDSFPALRIAAAQLSPGLRGLIFLLALIGFASKAGIVPLHAWLPRAHPEAPSHVSALMSAAMVSMGIYGILRTGFDLLGGGARWWWLLVLALGGISAIYGILQAAISTDLKTLLGYSTTENMGLVLVGVGAAGIFHSAGQPALAGLAIAAALLHVINHAGFKTLLFLAAGSVLYATGTRDLDQLGGLRPRMPATTAAFGLGALVASALPPGAAFVSEWLLLQALIHGLPAAGVATAIAMPLAVAAVALTAGLSVATFVKAFGIGFLARPRSAAAATAAESPAGMIAGMAVAATGCVALALSPTVILPGLSRVGSTLLGSGTPAARNGLTVRLVGVAGSLSPIILTVALLLALGVAAGTVRAVSTRRSRRDTRLWDGGAGPLSARMEYTATSFAEPLQRVFDDVLQAEQDVDVTHLAESQYLVAAVEYHRRVPDRVERRLYEPILRFTAAWGKVGTRLAPGSIHRYLGYGFYSLLALLLYLVVTR